jgi:hypothetical protein
MRKDKTIGLIGCYFGRLPWYFDYFVHSCSYNPTVQFFIITDDETYWKPLPSNVKLIHRTLQQVTELATEKLGFKVCVNTGYKMCDFKPAYGVIFSQWLSSYDFWGHTDIDIIFGDVRQFMTEDILNEYDLVSVRPDWLTGCFLLYRNQERINKLFTQSRDYRKVFTSPMHYCFDETNFAHDAFTAGISYLDIHTEIESMMHVVSRLEVEKRLKVYYDLHIIEGLPGKLRWENGRMYYRNKYEIMCYHLIYFKKRYTPKKIGAMPQSFKVSPTRIYHTPLNRSVHVI